MAAYGRKIKIEHGAPLDKTLFAMLKAATTLTRQAPMGETPRLEMRRLPETREWEIFLYVEVPDDIQWATTVVGREDEALAWGTEPL